MEIEMNIIDTLTARIEDRRTDTKNPCKNYSTQNAAELATARMAQVAATHFDKLGRRDAPKARYVVFFVGPWNRWVGAIDLTELLRRENSTGGYLGVCTGFYTY